MICIIDFDGTYLKNDFFAEVLFKYFLENPFKFFILFYSHKFNLLDVKIDLLYHHQIAYDTKFLVNSNVLNWINANKLRFSNVYIVSASPDFFLHKILNNHEIFCGIFGSTNLNLKGLEKLKFIQKKWNSDFVYIGDSNDDIPIFKVAKEAYKIINNEIVNVKAIYQVN
jgi:hypothetical protein